MVNKYDPFYRINEITNAVKLPFKEINNFYYNFNNAVNSLNKLVNPYISNAIHTLSNYAKAYSETLTEQHHYRQSIYIMWNNLEEELRLKNRYFPKNELINILDNLTKEAKYYLKKGAILYRARKISEQDFPEEVHKLINYIMEKNNTQSNSNKLY